MPENDADERIRVVVLGIVSREASDARADEELLVERHRHPTGDPFYRPLGGGVEFGEHSAEALRREFREELGVELTAVSPLGTYEDVFSADGRTHHELWRCYEAEIVEDWPYAEEEFTATEPDHGDEIDCVWKPVADFGPEGGDGETFYPGAALSDL